MADGYTMAELARAIIRTEAALEKLPAELAQQHVTRTEYMVKVQKLEHADGKLSERVKALEDGRSWWRGIGGSVLLIAIGSILGVILPRMLGAIQ